MCVCAWQRERERERDKQTDRQMTDIYIYIFIYGSIGIYKAHIINVYFNEFTYVHFIYHWASDTELPNVYTYTYCYHKVLIMNYKT